MDRGGCVFLSTDTGATWKPIFIQSQHVYDLTIDPNAPDNLYFCGFDAAAYRSTDAGLHWARIQGYNFKWGHRVIVDLISTTRTATGLEVEARLDTGTYPKKVKVSKEQMERVQLHPHDFHGDWNYTIAPTATKRVRHRNL